MTVRAPLFTVLTPTFNRVHLLPRLYASLCRQTLADFEWLVVDDGSTDSTEARLASWQGADAPFPVRYLRQSNMGKTTAMNRGVRAASGVLIAEVDSDDELLPNALQTLVTAWRRIEPAERHRFVGVTGLCVDDAGHIVGDCYPADTFVSDSLESRYRYGIRGEKWGFQRKDVLLSYPFPENLPTRHVPEGVVWDAIAREYKTLYINQPLRIYHSGVDQLTKRVASSSASTWFIYHVHNLNENMDYFRDAPVLFFKSAVQYGRASLHLRHNLRAQWVGAGTGKLLWLLGLPLSWLVYRRDLWRERRAK